MHTIDLRNAKPSQPEAPEATLDATREYILAALFAPILIVLFTSGTIALQSITGEYCQNNPAHETCAK